MKTLTDAKIEPGQKILLRVDFDVPVENGNIQEVFRVAKQKETLDRLLSKGAKVMMLGHVSDVDSFARLLAQLTEILGRDIVFVKDIPSIKDFLSSNAPLGLLENTRAWEGEKKNDDTFAEQLAIGFDTYINNAFAVCHREHASVAAITKFLPSYAGGQVVEELQRLSEAVQTPAEGKIIIMGGAKASTKVPVIKSLLPHAEAVLVGGVIANDILKERGDDIQNSIVDEDTTALFAGLDIQDTKLIIPTDFIIADNKFLDIGAESVARFVEIIKDAKMIIWNGPMGLFEDVRFLAGTKAVAQAIIDSEALSIIGGGDTISAVHKLGLLEKYSFVSTGGGAMLAFLAQEEMPALKALGYYDHN